MIGGLVAKRRDVVAEHLAVDREHDAKQRKQNRRRLVADDRRSVSMIAVFAAAVSYCEPARKKSFASAATSSSEPMI